MNDTYDIECGYEAGCLGYSLYNQLTAAGVKCVILAPTTMLTEQGQRIKTDSRDAHLIAQCLSYGGYHPVYIPTEQDDSVKEYLRMRDDHKKALKKILISSDENNQDNQHNRHILKRCCVPWVCIHKEGKKGKGINSGHHSRIKQ